MSGYCNCPDEVAKRRAKRAEAERAVWEQRTRDGVCLVPGCAHCPPTPAGQEEPTP